MIGMWLLIAVAVLGLQFTVGGATSDDFSIPGTEAQLGVDLLTDRFPSEGGVSGRVVFEAPDGTITDPLAETAVDATLAELAAGPHVLGVSDPYDPTGAAISADGRIAFATVRYDITPPGAAEGEAAEAAVDDRSRRRSPGRTVTRDRPRHGGRRRQRGDRARSSPWSCCSWRSVR